jgi:hypothetical protein
MINPKRASEIGGPLGLVESDISEIGKAAIVARIIRIAQLALPVLTTIMGILTGRYAFPPPQTYGGYPLAMASMAIPSMAIARRSSWKGTSILAVIGFILGFAGWTIYSITRPDPPVLMYGAYSR